MTVTAHRRTVYRAERTLNGRWEYDQRDGCREWVDSPHTQVRTFLTEWPAWKWVARAALFNARESRGGECSSPRHPEHECPLCDPAYWVPVVDRLARILRSRSRANVREGARQTV